MDTGINYDETIINSTQLNHPTQGNSVSLNFKDFCTYKSNEQKPHG